MAFTMLAKVSRGTILHDVQIPKTGGGLHPHLVDIYIPVTTNVQVTVCLHGGGGDKVSHAWQMGVLNSGVSSVATTNWQMIEFWASVAVFPQGQTTTNYATWSSGFMDSGYDDVAFLQDLKGWLVGQFPGLGINLSGHSAGAFMALRMWYDSPITFSHYISFSGTGAGSYFGTAVPALRRPLLRLNGRQDDILGILDWQNGSDHLYDDTWAQLPSHINREDVAFPSQSHHEGGWHQYVKAAADAGVTAHISDGVVAAARVGTSLTYKCDSDKQQLRVYSAAGHSVGDFHNAIGEQAFFTVCQWLHNV